MRKLLVLSALLLVSVVSWSQMNIDEVINVIDDPTVIAQHETEQLLKTTDLKGEVYSLKSPSLAVLKSVSGNKYMAKLNYNLGTNQIELYGGNQTFVFDSKFVERIETVDSTIVKTVFENSLNMPGTNNPQAIVEVLVEGNLNLIKVDEVSKSQAVYNDRLGAGLQSGQLLTKTYYYLYDGEEYSEVNKKKDVLNRMADKQGEIKEYIKVNVLSMRNPKHVSYVVDYYNKISS
ncbi:MAG: hypothetical protein RIC35_21690 [Marinoscillum sp.]